MIRRLIILALLVAGLLPGAAGMSPGKGLCWFNYDIGSKPNAVFDIFRDSSGRNWIGTTSGLYEFNGYQAYAARCEGWTFQAQVYAMTEAPDGRIYAGCNDGLFMLDPDKGEVTWVEGDFPREIRSLLLDGDTLLIGSLSGLRSYNIVSGAIADLTPLLPHRAVYSLLRSAEGTVYVGTYNGAVALDRRLSDARILNCSGYAPAAGNLFVNALAQAPSGEIYLGTEGALLRHSPRTGATSVVAGSEGYIVKSLALTDSAIIAGTDHGLLEFGPGGKVAVFRHDSRMPSSIASNVVWSLQVDSEGNVWCGTEVGLSIVDPWSPVRVFPIADLTGSGAGQQVYNILRDSRGYLWLGGTNGLIRLGGGEKAKWFMPADGGISHNRIRDIMESSDGELRVATDGGINIYERGKARFVNHRMADRRHRLNANWAYGILEDAADSSLWVAGYLGGIFRERLDRFHREGTTHTADTVFSTLGGAIANDLIGQMVQDSDGNKWVLHFRDSALTRIDSRTQALTRVPVREITGEEPVMLCPAPGGGLWCGFYGGVVYMEPDGTIESRPARFPFGTGDESVKAMGIIKGQLWVATSAAVFSIDPADMEARLLALPAKNYTAIYFDPQSQMAILGADDEIVLVEPGRLLAEHYQSELGSVTMTEGDTRATVIPGQESLPELPAHNRNVSIDLSTDEFSPGRYLRFCYRLDNDSTWQLLAQGCNSIGFTTLTSGKHTLELAVAGVPSSRRSVNINVARPWYLTKTAIALYLIAAMALVTALVMWQRRRQQRRIEELERASVLATVENRMFFLANISHELKTPLSMIIGPLSKIRTGEGADEAKADIDTAYQNAIKLNSLIHQTVEINRMELHNENMLIYSRIDAVEFCRDIFDSYRRSTVEARNFVFTAPEPHIYVRIDAVKLESLVSNLISNAIKYTREGATVALSVARDGDYFTVDVSDDGVGIPAEELSLVFQRMYRSPRTAGSREGTGIGLYLVRQYATLLGGTVSVESRVDEGSTFRLRLPMGDEASEETAANAEEGAGKSDRRPRVLIVDDNRSIAAFISSVLSGECNCAVASNGKAALAVAASFRPDLIIADEMMPVMSGLEMCRRLRANTAMAGVPILLLTANDSPEVHSESISAGADAFMPKPFETPVLTAKVRQLLERSRRNRSKIPSDDSGTTAAAESAAESAAEKQLAKVTEVIENNISNPDLNVDFLCRAVDLPAKSLYRLIKKYMGVPPVDYIRQTRLRKAAVLLEQKKFSVSEVMYMVGFSSSSYFSKCFAAMFGCTPGQYPPES